MAKQVFRDGTEVVGFYARTVKTGPFVFVSGTTSLDAKGRVQGKDAAQQTVVTMRKIESALKSAGAKLKDLTRLTIFVTDIRDMGRDLQGARQGAQGLGGQRDDGRRQPARRARPRGRDRIDGGGRGVGSAGSAALQCRS